LVASVAWPLVTVVAKRTQRLHWVWEGEEPKPMMHGHEKSDSNIVAVKPANKAEQPFSEQSAKARTAAESVEPKTETEGNAGQQARTGRRTGQA